MAINIDGNGLITLGGTASTQGRVRLSEDTDNGTNYIELAAPASIAADVTFTLPAADGTSGQVIQTNGSGALSFATPSAGKVLQVVSVTTSTDTTITATSYTDITNLSASITPTSATSKILVLVQLSGRCFASTNADRTYDANIVRGATVIHEVSTDSLQSGVGSAGFAIYPVLSSLIFLDSPATTSSTTYKSQARVSNSADSTSISLNASGNASSTIVIMEIAA